MAALLVLVAVLRIVDTYDELNHTIDEPAHLSGGVEWLERGGFVYGPDHPPLARIAVALGPKLSGVRLAAGHHAALDRRQSGRVAEWWRAQFEAGADLLEQGGRYFSNLARARAGILPFFVLAVWVTWRWSRAAFGAPVAAVAVLLLTTLPPVLAHAGLATTDMAATALMLAGLWALVRWLERAGRRESVALGATWGLAALAKFSALVLLPVCALALATARWLLGRRRAASASRRGTSARAVVAAIALAGGVAFAVVWAGYRFSLEPLAEPGERPHTAIDRVLGPDGPLRGAAYAAVEAPIYPLTEFVRGVWLQKEHNERGHPSYLLGRHSTTGHRLFFPAALLVKTPLAFLLLSLAGCAALTRLAPERRTLAAVAPAVCAAAILVAVLPARLNLGVRYVLIAYPLLAIPAALAAVRLWRSPRRRPAARALVVSLLAWHVVSTTAAHPDYLAYFNEIAAGAPERFLVDSDLDWGQDLHRLAEELERRGVEHVNLAYFGNARPEVFALPRYTVLPPHRPVTGWVAVSLSRLAGLGEPAPRDGFAWLAGREPVATAGRSIRLYYIPGPGAPSRSR